MKESRYSIQFCGFGGQGLVLSATVFGTAAVLAGLNAVQTQSYGSEARGGECQAELSLSEEPINSPLVSYVDLLVALSQPALDSYLPRLRPGGTLVIDPQYVKVPDRSDVRIIEVPVSRLAVEEAGSRISANMIMLGFLREATGLMPEKALLAAIRKNVADRFVEINLKAERIGRQLAISESVMVEA
ncbi:2-oxoacid:acceptor oxidoreductase family protein [Candidatus Bipolaricaulota bacterium]